MGGWKSGSRDTIKWQGKLDSEFGEIQHTPTKPKDIVNKEYADSITPTHTESTTDELTNKTIDSFTNQVEADEIHIRIRNESGSIMTKGQLVFISGYNVGLDRTLVTLTDASSSSTMPCLGMINDGDIANNADGHCTVYGRVFDIDTSAFSVGDTAYVSTTAGEMSTRPSGTSEEVQAIGVVLRSQANNGVIQIIGAGRTNDIPNDIDHDTDIINVSADDHHPQSHDIASHSDTTATGAELETLTDGSETTLHSHAGGGAGKIHVISNVISPMGSDFSTSSTSYVDITGLTTTIVTGVTSTIMAWLSCGMKNSGGFSTSHLQLIIDGTASGEAIGGVGADSRSQGNVSQAKTGVASATITVKAQGRVGANTSIFFDTTDNIMILAIEE